MYTLTAQLYNQMNESAGLSYLGRRKGLKFSYHIYYKNKCELIDACLSLETLEIKINDKLRLDDAHMEVARLFHNFLASACSLIDAARIFMEYYNKTELYERYNNIISANFKHDGLCLFIKILRNYIIHKGMPHISLITTIRADIGLETFFFMDRDRLLDWKKWQGATAFLQKSEEKISISIITQQYFTKTEKLYTWLFSELDKHHQQDIDAYKELQKRLSDI